MYSRRPAQTKARATGPARASRCRFRTPSAPTGQGGRHSAYAAPAVTRPRARPNARKRAAPCTRSRDRSVARPRLTSWSVGQRVVKGVPSSNPQAALAKRGPHWNRAGGTWRQTGLRQPVTISAIARAVTTVASRAAGRCVATTAGRSSVPSSASVPPVSAPPALLASTWRKAVATACRRGRSAMVGPSTSTIEYPQGDQSAEHPLAKASGSSRSIIAFPPC